jgi:alkylhydroperoxidase family enzyme
LEELYKKYGDRVQFLAVYVREAHPTDGWREPNNDRVGISILQPKSKNAREDVAAKCCSTLEITMPMVIDEMHDPVGHLYSGMPDRLYIIDRAGKVAYKGGRGPFGFKTGEMEQSLLMLLLDQDSNLGQPPRVPILSDEQAKGKLPKIEQGRDAPLPVWARMLAEPLPNTTAAMLRLDYLHRAKSPLDPVLRGKVRWMAAHMNRCQYSEAYAAADLRRAGVREEAIRELAGELSKLSDAERAALLFARKMTLDAATVTDAEMARLRQLYGDQSTVALVLLLAYANFQDRLLLAIGAEVEPGGPYPPCEVGFAADAHAAAPERMPIEARQVAGLSAIPADPDWTSVDFGELQKLMEEQRAREPRIPVPRWEDARKALPPEATADRPPLRIRWSLVCLGYQPELARAWGACMGAFAADSKQDRVFEETLFWVVTRSLRCFY